MAKNIKISIAADPSCEEPEVIIKAKGDSPAVEKIINAIEQCMDEEYPRITVFDEDRYFLIDQWDVIRIYTESRRLKVCTVSGIFEAGGSLSEMEGRLDDGMFTRISRFEIVNLKRISSFDMSISGTIRVVFEDGSQTWVARRYVRAITNQLALKKTKRAQHSPFDTVKQGCNSIPPGQQEPVSPPDAVLEAEGGECHE